MACARHQPLLRRRAVVAALAAAVAAAAAAAAGTATPAVAALSAGDRCSVSGSRIPPKECAYGLTCILDDLGQPEVDRPDSGVCTTTPSPLKDCTVTTCAAEGAAFACRLAETDRVTTCEVYSRIPDVCGIICTQECLEPPLCASDGTAFCNACGLSGASCDGGFNITGPVQGATCSFDWDDDGDGGGGGGGGNDDDGNNDGKLNCSGEINPFDARRCCVEQDIGCIKEGAACTNGALIPGVPCVDGLTCVIFDMGNLPVDQPDAGTCEALDGRPPPCTAELCAEDSDARCAITGRVLTCAAFEAGVGGGPVGTPGPPGGPVTTPTPVDCDAANLDVLARGRCCREQQKACAVVDESCCVGGNCGIVPPVPCASGLVCLGNPPVDGNPAFGNCGYNCKTKEVWTPAKTEWCCRVEGAGCPVASSTPKPYNCLTEEVWTADKLAWCCANKKLGCASTPASKRCDGVEYTLCRHDTECPKEEVCVEKRLNKPASCALRAVSGNFYCTAVGCNEETGSGGFGGYEGYYRRGERDRMGHCSPKLG